MSIGRIGSRDRPVAPIDIDAGRRAGRAEGFGRSLVAAFDELRRRLTELVGLAVQRRMQTDAFDAPPRIDAASQVRLGAPSVGPLTGRPAVFTGFDNAKLEGPLKTQADGQPKSAKYTFAKLAQQAGMPPHKQQFLAQGMSGDEASRAAKQAAGDWFTKYIKPGMEAAGFAVGWVKGDKALIATRENPGGEVVDFLRGAGSDDPNYTAVAWQPESGGVDAVGPMDAGGPGIVSTLLESVRSRYRDRLRAGVSREEREENMKFLRDRIIEEGRNLGLDLAWNKKRGTGPHSIDAIAWRHDGRVDVVDIGQAYDDTTRALALQWAIVGGPPGYDPNGS